MIDAIFCASVATGVFFMVVASLGLLRLPDFYARLHAPTKAATLGLAFLLLAFALEAGEASAIAKAVLCLLFVGVTVPVGAHILARAAHRCGVPAVPPARPDEYTEFSRTQRHRTDDAGDVEPTTREQRR